MCDVLLVEDQEVVRMVLLDMLEDDGFAVREAATPWEALRIAEEPAGCSLLVTDIDLGVSEMDGFAIATRLQHKMPGMPVLFVSGRPGHFAGRSCAANERVLVKPFSRVDLISAVRALLPSLPDHTELTGSATMGPQRRA